MEQQRRMLGRECRVIGVHLFSAFDVRTARHYEVIETSSGIRSKLRDGGHGNSLVSLDLVQFVNRREADFLEITFGLSLPKRLVKDDLSIHVLAVIAKWRGRELDYWTISEVPTKRLPCSGRDVMRFVDE